MKIATVGVHVLDTHVIGIESIPDGSDGQLVETIRMSPAGTAGGTAVVQDPANAAYPTMPAAALRECTPDAVLPLHELAELLLHWGTPP